MKKIVFRGEGGGCSDPLDVITAAAAVGCHDDRIAGTDLDCVIASYFPSCPSSSVEGSRTQITEATTKAEAA